MTPFAKLKSPQQLVPVIKNLFTLFSSWKKSFQHAGQYFKNSCQIMGKNR